jgi:hypothetical protein
VRISILSRQLVSYLVLAILVSVVFAMAWPRLLASLQFLPVQSAQSRLYLASAATDEPIDALISRSEQAVSFHDAYPYHSSLSFLYFLKGLNADSTLFSRREAMGKTLEESKLALAGAPLQPDLWLRMAQVGVQTFMPASEVTTYFQMAIWSGRVEPTHFISRLQIGFSLQSQLDEAGLNLLRDQVLLAWNMRQPEFKAAIKMNRLNYKRIHHLMASTHPDVVREMEADLGPVSL